MGIFEGKTHFSALIEQAKNGATILVTKNGQPVAQICPVDADKAVTARRTAAKRLLSIEATLGPDLTVRDLIDEGRRY